MQTKLYRSYFVEQLAKSSVYVCVFFYSFDFLKTLILWVLLHIQRFLKQTKNWKKNMYNVEKHWHL